MLLSTTSTKFLSGPQMPHSLLCRAKIRELRKALGVDISKTLRNRSSSKMLSIMRIFFVIREVIKFRVFFHLGLFWKGDMDMEFSILEHSFE